MFFIETSTFTKYLPDYLALAYVLYKTGSRGVVNHKALRWLFYALPNSTQRSLPNSIKLIVTLADGSERVVPDST